MTKHKPALFTRDALISHIWDWEDISDYPDLINADSGETVAEPGFYVCDWPDHCVSTQHLGDASIHGPFTTEAEAMDVFPDAD